MHLLRKLLSGLLQLIAMSVLLLGSCVGPGVLYVQSSKWFLEPDDAEKSRMFFVAFHAKNDQGKENLYTVLQRRDIAKAGYTDTRYQLPAGEHREERDDTEPHASITVVNEPSGSQPVKVYMMGDSPWASLSEYGVRDNQVEPLRYGHSNALFFLIGIPLYLIGMHYLMKPITRGINRMVGVELKTPTSTT